MTKCPATKRDHTQRELSLAKTGLFQSCVKKLEGEGEDTSSTPPPQHACWEKTAGIILLEERSVTRSEHHNLLKGVKGGGEEGCQVEGVQNGNIFFFSKKRNEKKRMILLLRWRQTRGPSLSLCHTLMG